MGFGDRDSGRWPRVSAFVRKIASLYHAAAVMASNYIGALIHASVTTLEAVGITRSAALTALSPLAKTSLENSLRLGPVEALTGPIERGDSATVLAHRRRPAKYFSAGEATVLLCRTTGGPNGSVTRFAKQ